MKQNFLHRSALVFFVAVAMLIAHQAGAQGIEQRITSNNEDQEASAIDGNTIVWQDNRHGNWDIYSRTINPDGTLGEERRVTDDSASQYTPAISGNIIVWKDYRNLNYDIYLRTIDFDGTLGGEVQVTDRT